MEQITTIIGNIIFIIIGIMGIYAFYKAIGYYGEEKRATITKIRQEQHNLGLIGNKLYYENCKRVKESRDNERSTQS